MSISPDTKDLTWVPDHSCPECGFEASAVDVPDVPELLTSNAAAWDLVRPCRDVRRWPSEATWSPLEYACHGRDVYRIFAVRLRLMLDPEDPQFEKWDQDATAVEERYEPQDLVHVRHELDDAAAAVFAAVRPEQSLRPGRRFDGAAFTVRRLSQRFGHDTIHHLGEATRD